MRPRYGRARGPLVNNAVTAGVGAGSVGPIGCATLATPEKGGGPYR